MSTKCRLNVDKLPEGEITNDNYFCVDVALLGRADDMPSKLGQHEPSFGQKCEIGAPLNGRCQGILQQLGQQLGDKLPGASRKVAQVDLDTISIMGGRPWPARCSVDRN